MVVRTFALLAVFSPLSFAQTAQTHDMSTMSHRTAQTHDMSTMSHPQHPKPTVPQFASGTSWQPSSTAERMWMWRARDWQVMAHANIFLTYNRQGGPRGVSKLESENWAMLMEERSFGRVRLQLRQMLSLEPLTTPKPGFPQLFQTGEVYRGAAIVDAQHPHDLFSEISVMLSGPLGERASWFLYGGPAGEPALGPTAFPHRVSAMENPAAPLGHHVQDSTHISYGVVTSGLVLGRAKAEASAFNGREPDEHRYNFDMGALDSWAVRFSAAPGRNWTAQYSYGHLTHPESQEPGNLNRQTASLSYNRPWARGYWASTLVWGRNRKQHNHTVQNSYLLESSLNFGQRNYAFTRLELVDKDELISDEVFRIAAFTFGGVRDLVRSEHGLLGVGAGLTFYAKPAALDALYGRHPVSLQVFLRFRPK